MIHHCLHQNHPFAIIAVEYRYFTHLSMNINAMSYTCGKNRRSIRFKTVRFKGIDYISEASARRQLMINLLELPVPLQLLGYMFPHNGKLQDNAYRTPWSNKILTSILPVTGSLMEDLKECTGFGDCLERLNIFQVRTGRGPDELVLSSNPSSQCSISATEALWHLEEVEISGNTSPWEESFTPCTLDDSSFSYDDLTLPEEVMFTDRLRFINHLPSVHTMLQRLKLMTVSDPFLHSSAMLSDNVIFRHCASYTAVSDIVPDVTAPEENLTEVFEKESILNEESLMLAVEVHMESVRSHETSFSLRKLQDLLNLTPESIEDKKPCADLHMEVTSADEHKTEVLQTEESSSWDSNWEPKSPGALRLYTEMELDLPLSPCNDLPPDLFLPDGPLSPEQLSPVYKRHFMSDSDFENREKSVWMAEKHRECMVGFFLAEPQMSKPSVHTQTLSDLLMLLKVRSEHVENMDRPHLTDTRAMLPKNFTDLSVYTENFQTADIETHQIDKFSPLSIVQIDEMLFAASFADHPAAVPPAPSKHPETYKDEEKTVKLLRIEQTREINCKTAQTVQHVSNSTSFKHKTPERCPKRNDSRTICPSGEQPSFSKEVSESPLLKHRDMKVMSTVHEHAERFDQKRERMSCGSSQLSNSSNSRQVNSLHVKSHESMDPLSFFMMLRSSKKSPVQTPRQSTPASAEVNVRQISTENALPVQRVNRGNLVSNAERFFTSTEKILTHEERPINKTIYVQATEIQRSAYRELNVLAVPCLSRAVESGVTALNNRDFATLSPELTRFLLKQQERKHHTQQGADGVLDDITLLHVLVTLKELLLRCDLHAAADYLSQVRGSCHLKCLEELMKMFEVLHYLSLKRSEPDPKLLELQNQMSTWMSSNMNHNNRVLVLTVKPVNTGVLTALRQVSGNTVCAVSPEDEKSAVICRDVMNSLSGSRCVVVCRQHIGADFPWCSFSLVFELHCVDHSPFSSLCSERNIKYISFSTAVPEFNSKSASFLDSIPFVLLVTDGLLKRSRIQRALETTYDMTLLERKHPPSAQKLGGDRYDVITVDENTAVFIQELSELEMEKASNRVVMRLSSLSLQFTRCWLILHCSESHRALISRSIHINLVLIYSSFVLFGQQPEKFDVKVLLAYEEEEIARYIYRISVHTFMSSDRDALSFLDRDWISVQTTEEERCLLQFPCINPLVAQLMLSRAPSLQWLLEASLVDLQEMFPQVPHKVIKLFSDITAEHKVKTAASESEDEASSQTNISAHLPHPPQPQTEICQSQPSTEYFTVSLSGRQEGKSSIGQFRELIGQPLCLIKENHISDPAWTLSNTLFSQDSATAKEEGRAHFISDPTPVEAAVLSGPQMLSFRNTVCEFSCKRQDQTHWTSPENTADHRTEERKRLRSEDANSVPPQCKRGKLLCERVPGRNDGQTRLRFF
ncbi:protein shortage in chiasmata 1 ortholog isoform X2 [Triplophysa dalaica]|uniref:protein shortage in chiasmata 1 ortholog isoform X2 n=1 Tax=Triplophysa dalaica TaxID=1582913 RepID=UPI0024DF4DF4|nr:protein shortage in chiasmata 1 ortholog isoform X2 [Triplophysa dalaica]